MKNQARTGALLIALGIFFVYWAETHSPKNLGKVIGNAFSGSYTMSEYSYYITMGVGAIMCVYGILRIVKKK